MRTKLLLSLCMAALPFSMVGCDSGSEVSVGTGTAEPPPDVKARIEKQNADYQKFQEQQQSNPTPSDGQAIPPAGG